MWAPSAAGRRAESVRRGLGDVIQKVFGCVERGRIYALDQSSLRREWDILLHVVDIEHSGATARRPIHDDGLNRLVPVDRREFGDARLGDVDGLVRMIEIER